MVGSGDVWEKAGGAGRAGDCRKKKGDCGDFFDFGRVKSVWKVYDMLWKANKKLRLMGITFLRRKVRDLICNK